MPDFPLMLWVNSLVADRIQLQSNIFATSVENKTAGVSKFNDSPVHIHFISLESSHDGVIQEA